MFVPLLSVGVVRYVVGPDSSRVSLIPGQSPDGASTGPSCPAGGVQLGRGGKGFTFSQFNHRTESAANRWQIIKQGLQRKHLKKI